MTQASSFFYV